VSKPAISYSTTGFTIDNSANLCQLDDILFSFGIAWDSQAATLLRFQEETEVNCANL